MTRTQDEEAQVSIEVLREQVQQPQEVREAREIFTRSVESTFSLEAFLAALQDLQEAAGIHPDISSTAAYWRGRTRTSERIISRALEAAKEPYTPAAEAAYRAVAILKEN